MGAFAYSEPKTAYLVMSSLDLDLAAQLCWRCALPLGCHAQRSFLCCVCHVVRQLTICFLEAVLKLHHINDTGTLPRQWLLYQLHLRSLRLPRTWESLHHSLDVRLE